MNTKYAKKFLMCIWIIIIGLAVGYLFGRHLDKKKIDNYNTELAEYEASTEEPLVQTYTTEEIEEWQNTIDSNREDAYKSFSYCLTLSDYDLSSVDSSLYEYADYGENEDNTSVLAKVVFALQKEFGNSIEAYKFIDVTYDDNLMQGIYVIQCTNIIYDVAISQDNLYAYVNIKTESVDDSDTENIILVEE